MGWFNFTTGVTPNWQIDGTLTVGADDTGYDVTFYGDTSGKKFVWDASADKLIITGDFTVTGTTTLATSLTGILRGDSGVVSVDTTAVLKALFDAHTILYATTDNLPVALTVTEQTLVGRLTGENITAIALGIADNNILQVDHASPADDDYAKFTNVGIEGRSYAELRADINMDALNEPTGFPNRTDSVLSFTGVTFTINKTNGSFDYYIAGVKYTKTAADDIVIADTSGVHFIYYDGSTLTEAVNPNTATLEDILLNKAWVATIYWQTTGAGTGIAPLLGDERHGAIMSGKTHLWFHIVHGAAYGDGLTLSGYTEDTDSDAALTFEITDGHYDDEDLEHAIIDGDPATQYSQQLNDGDASIPIVYKNASGVWVEDAASTLPYKLISAGNRLAFNRDDGGGNWSQVEVTDGKWVSMTLIATNDWQYPIKAIQGQNEYTDKKTAVEDATAEVIAFGGGTLSPEVFTLYRFVLNTKDTFGGSKKTKIEVDGVTDFRTSTIIGGAAVATDHGALSGLADDDHAQYLLADGSRALAGAWDMGSQNLTNVDIDSGTLDGVTITAPIIDGTVTNTGAALVLPAFTLGGTVTANNQGISGASYLSQAGTPATGGFIRLANNQVIQWRNQGNTGNKALYLDSTDVFVFNAPLYVMGALELTGGLTLGGKLTAGANEIEGSVFDINGGTIDGVTITSPNLNEAVALTATATELNLLDLAGLTAGELLVATGAATAAWQSTGVKLSAPDISGSVTAATALTLPAFTGGGAISMGTNDVVFTNGRMESGPWADYVKIGNNAGDAVGNLYCGSIEFTGNVVFDATTAFFSAANVNGATLIIRARDTDNFVIQVGKLLGAADPEFQLGPSTPVVRATAGGLLSFFNATPVAQQNVPLTTPAVQDVIDALVTLGLVEQSDP